MKGVGVFEAEFLGDEGDGLGGADGCAEGESCVAVETGGDVDGEDGCGLFVDPFDEGEQVGADGLGEAGAEQAVDEQVGFDGGGVIGEGDVERDSDVEIGFGVAGALIVGACGVAGDVVAAEVKVSCGGEGVAAVVAGAD